LTRSRKEKKNLDGGSQRDQSVSVEGLNLCDDVDYGFAIDICTHREQPLDVRHVSVYLSLSSGLRYLIIDNGGRATSTKNITDLTLNNNNNDNNSNL